MKYSKKDFAIKLKQQLAGGYDVVKVSRWAYQEYLVHCRKLESGLKPEIMKVIAMEEGPEFEMTEPEIQKFTNDLETQ